MIHASDRETICCTAQTLAYIMRVSGCAWVCAGNISIPIYIPTVRGYTYGYRFLCAKYRESNKLKSNAHSTVCVAQKLFYIHISEITTPWGSGCWSLGQPYDPYFAPVPIPFHAVLLFFLGVFEMPLCR